MGYFKSFTAGGANGNKTTVRVDRNIHTLCVRRLSDVQTDYSLRGNNTEIVNATIQGHNGTLEDVIKRCTLGDLAAFSQYGSAPIFEMATADAAAEAGDRQRMAIQEGLAVPSAGKWLAMFAIQLTADGVSVAVGPQDDFVFTFENLPDGAIYDFIGIEGETTGTNILHYQTLNILQDQREADLDVDALVGIVVPNSLAFKRVLLTHKNGVVSKNSLAELKYLSSQHNPGFITQNFAYASARTLPTVMCDVLNLPLHEVTRIELDTDGTPLAFLTVFNRSRLAV